MKILVDADAFPAVLKEILFRAVERTCIKLIMVANKQLRVPDSVYISKITVSSGFDEADNMIAELAEKDDLVITADIPLADRDISKGAAALNPRGELYTESNIKNKLAMRELLNELRSTGEIGGGPSAYNERDRRKFADQLNKILAKSSKNSQFPIG